MQIVIGAGQPRHLEFTIVCERESIPADANIYAVFAGDSACVPPDEHLFDALTDEKYDAFCALAQEAREIEASSRRAKVAT